MVSKVLVLPGIDASQMVEHVRKKSCHYLSTARHAEAILLGVHRLLWGAMLDQSFRLCKSESGWQAEGGNKPHLWYCTLGGTLPEEGRAG
jgi:hypothetical protein